MGFIDAANLLKENGVNVTHINVIEIFNNIEKGTAIYEYDKRIYDFLLENNLLNNLEQITEIATLKGNSNFLNYLRNLNI